MALLETPSQSHQEVHDNFSEGGGQGGGPWFNAYYSGHNSVRSPPMESQHNSGGGGGNGSLHRKEMPVPSSGNGGGLAPPPGLPHSSSTAELVALGLIGSDTADETATVGSSEYNSDGGGYDPRSPGLVVAAGNGGVVGGTGVGTTGGLGVSTSSGLVSSLGGSAGGVNVAGTGSAGGMGLGLKTPSLTNLANMVRSHSVSSFHSENSLFTDPATTTESPAWGSHKNVDTTGGTAGGSGGGNPAAASTPLATPISSSLGSLPGSHGGGSGGAGVTEAELSAFAARGLAASRRVPEDEHHSGGMGSWSASAAAAAAMQRRPVGTSAVGGHGGLPRSSAMPSNSRRSMVYNHSDTDLVASFSRLGFPSVGSGTGTHGAGAGGTVMARSLGRASGGLEAEGALQGGSGRPSSHWSPLTSPNSSPMFGTGAPLLEDSLHLGPGGHSLEQTGMGGGGGGVGGAGAGVG
ncbi:unnamed protein product, partial [Discosporangium mesarthrocarpum]